MQKVTKILEQYVQWIALALGVLWIGWMGYSYWVTPPDRGIVNGEPVSPGEVDEKVADSQFVTALAQAHQNIGPYPEPIREMLAGADRPKYIDQFKTQLAGVDPTSVPLAPSPFMPNIGTTITAEGPGNGGGTYLLPDVQGALTLETSIKDGSAAQTGMSVVSRPDANVPVTPQGTQGALQQTLIQNPLNPTAQQIAVVPEEVTWVSVSGSIDMKKLAAAFTSAKITPGDDITVLLKTELVREELQPDGKWGNEKVVGTLTNEFQPPWPPANQAAEGDYLVWATAHTADIVEPPFYEVLRGNLWKTVHMPDPADAAAQTQQASFNPADVKPGDVFKLPPDQLKAWQVWHQQQLQQQQQQHHAPAPAPARGGAGPAGGGGHAMLDSPMGATIILVGDHGADPDRVAPGGRTFVPSAAPGMAPNPNNGQQLAIPAGAFIPAQQGQDLEVWAHDETTVPGTIYRYKLRVYIKNPLFATVNVAKNPADALIFSLKMETDWSKPIQSPTKHEFFVTNGGSKFGGVSKVGVDYLDWQDGNWKLVSMTLQPGDRIGQTPWTIIDLRPVAGASSDSVDCRVLLLNDNGQLATRFYKTDRTDPRYLKLRALVPPPVVPPGGTPTAIGA